MSGNGENTERISMAEELMNLITVEEYVKVVTAFPSTNYINKLELASLKKMIAGKLWVDSRKFVSRQNSVVINGLFALFGATLGKSASEIRAESCDHLLDPDNKSLRDMLRVSITQSGRSYSNWIRRLSSDEFPCDEFGLFLLSYMYKRHVIVILMDKLWCSFVSSQMSTFEKLCKSDHTLVWLGDDKYAEVKPLQIKGSNIAEWQLLADSVDHLHDKNKTNKKQQRRAEKATASVSTPTKTKTVPPFSQQKTRASSKRDSKISIDYKQFHEVGTFEQKKRKIEKFLPSTGPSETRLEAQQQITKSKESTRKVVTADSYQPRAQYWGQ